MEERKGIFNGNETILKRSERFGSRDFDGELMLYYRETRARHSRGSEAEKEANDGAREVEKPELRFGTVIPDSFYHFPGARAPFQPLREMCFVFSRRCRSETFRGNPQLPDVLQGRLYDEFSI